MNQRPLDDTRTLTSAQLAAERLALKKRRSSREEVDPREAQAPEQAAAEVEASGAAGAFLDPAAEIQVAQAAPSDAGGTYRTVRVNPASVSAGEVVMSGGEIALLGLGGAVIAGGVAFGLSSGSDDDNNDDGGNGSGDPRILSIAVEKSAQSNTGAANEGSTVTFVIRANVGNELIDYTLSGIQASDISGPLQGTLLVGSDGIARLQVTLVADATLEGAETLSARFTLGEAPAQLATVEIADTSVPVVPFAVTATPSVTAVNEGAALTFALQANRTPPTGTYTYRIEAASGSVTSGDVSTLTGNVTFDAMNRATVSLDVTADLLTEGVETLRLRVLEGDTVVGTSAVVTINDTSVAPPALALTITPASTAVDEGDSLSFAITSNRPDLAGPFTYAVMRSNASAQNPDTTPVTGTVTLDAQGRGTVTLDLLEDRITEGAETLTLRISQGSTVVGTSAVVTINDTSVAPVYSVTPSLTAIDEGGSLQFSIASSVAETAGPFAFRIVSQDGTPLTGDVSPVSGTLALDATGRAQVQVEVLEDRLTEGVESIRFQILQGGSEVLASSASVTLRDTSLTPDNVALGEVTFQATPLALNSAPEGTLLRYRVQTAGVEGESIRYTLAGVSSNDIDVPLEGEILLDSLGQARLEVAVKADALTEGAETLTVSFSGGEDEITLSPLTIQDTSRASATDARYTVLGVPSMSEGDSASFVINTTNVPSGTAIRYNIVGLDRFGNADLDGTPATGSVTVDATGRATLTVDIAQDAIADAGERFVVQLLSAQGALLAQSAPTQVLDDEPAPQYIFNIEGTSFDEGTSIPFTVATANVAPNTVLGFRLVPFDAPGAEGLDDRDVAALDGTLVVDANGIATGELTLLADRRADGLDRFRIEILDGDGTSFVSRTVAISPVLTVQDTSQVATSFTFQPASLDLEEGETLSVQVTGTNIAPGAVVDYRITGTGITAADFDTPLTGSLTLDANRRATLALDANADVTTEGTETLTLALLDAQGQVLGSASGDLLDSAVAPATYTLTPSATTMNEGTTITVNLETTQVPEGRELTLRAVAINGSTFAAADLGTATRTVTVGADGKASATFSAVADVLTEGEERFRVQLENDTGDVLAMTGAVSIVDTSQAKTYDVITSAPQVNEGASLVATVVTTGIANGTVLNYRLDAASGSTFTAADVAAATGTVTIANNTGTIIINVANDALVEGLEAFVVVLADADGAVLDTSSPVSIVNTTVASPTYSVTPAAGSLDEGASLNIAIDTSNVPAGTMLNYVVNAVGPNGATAADFQAASGPVMLDAQGDATLVLNALADMVAEGAESFSVSLRDANNAVLATSSAVTLNDTSISSKSVTFQPQTLTLTEGQNSSIVITGFGFNAGDMVTYRIAGNVAAADFGNPLTGTLTLDPNRQATLNLQPLSDGATEGTESLTLEILSGATVVGSTTGTLAEPAPPLTATVAAPTTLISEGSAARFLVTTNAPAGTELEYVVNLAGGATASDVQQTLGTFVVGPGASTQVLVQTLNDAVDDSLERISLSVLNSKDEVVATSAAVTIVDGFILTTGDDTGPAFTGTNANDRYYAGVVDSLGSGDVLNGGLGTDRVGFITQSDQPPGGPAIAPTLNSIEEVGIALQDGARSRIDLVNAPMVQVLDLTGGNGQTVFQAENFRGSTLRLSDVLANAVNVFLASAPGPRNLMLETDNVSTGSIAFTAPDMQSIDTLTVRPSNLANLGTLAVTTATPTRVVVERTPESQQASFTVFNNVREVDAQGSAGIDVITIGTDTRVLGAVTSNVDRVSVEAGSVLVRHVENVELRADAVGVSLIEPTDTLDVTVTEVVAPGDTTITLGAGDDTVRLNAGDDTVRTAGGNDRVVLNQENLDVNDDIDTGGGRDILALFASLVLDDAVLAGVRGAEILELTRVIGLELNYQLGTNFISGDFDALTLIGDLPSLGTIAAAPAPGVTQSLQGIFGSAQDSLSIGPGYQQFNLVEANLDVLTSASKISVIHATANTLTATLSAFNDSIVGGAGLIVVRAGDGDDSIQRGSGGVRVLFEASEAANGLDTIQGFAAGASPDRLDLTQLLPGGVVIDGAAGGGAMDAFTTNPAAPVSIENGVFKLVVAQGSVANADALEVLFEDGGLFENLVIEDGEKAVVVLGEAGVNERFRIFELQGVAGQVEAGWIAQVQSTDFTALTDTNFVLA